MKARKRKRNWLSVVPVAIPNGADASQTLAEKAPKDVERIALQSIPGLVYFGAEPLRVPVEETVKRVRVSVPGYGRLDLDQVELTGVDPDAMARARVTLSSTHQGGRNPKGYLTGKSIRSAPENDPYWEIVFTRQTWVDEILITNRVGATGAKSFALNVAVTSRGRGDDENVTTFNNLGAETILGRIEEFRGRLNKLLRHVGKLPETERTNAMSACERVKNTAEVLIGGTWAALAGAGPDRGKLAKDRNDLMQAVFDIVNCVEGPGLGMTVRRAGAVLDWLLARDRRADASFAEIELHALVAVLSAFLLRNKHVKRKYLLENAALIDTPERVEYVEALVNQLYERASGDLSLRPIMFRKHGMRGPRLHADASAYVASMKEIETYFEKIGYEVAICYGTLLGAVRDSGFIPHDDDIDMAVMLKGEGDLKQEMDAIMKKLGRLEVPARYAGHHQFLKVTAPKAGKSADIFPVIPLSDGQVSMYMEDLRIRPVPRELVLPFRTIQFYDETFLAPSNPEAFLADRYGSDWQVPKRPVGDRWMVVRTPQAPPLASMNSTKHETTT